VFVTAFSLEVLQQHQQPLQQCTSLFSHIQTYLQGERVCKPPVSVLVMLPLAFV
jgi:hypothetical protein